MNETTNISCVKCVNTDETTKIISHFTNLSQSNCTKDCLSITVHVPQIMY